MLVSFRVSYSKISFKCFYFNELVAFPNDETLMSACAGFFFVIGLMHNVLSFYGRPLEKIKVLKLL